MTGRGQQSGQYDHRLPSASDHSSGWLTDRIGTLSQKQRLYLSVLIGICGALVCLSFRAVARDNGDFWWALHTALALLNGRDPYAGLGPTQVAYPLPIAVVGLPMLLVPNIGASIVFVGISTGLLTYGALRDNTPWELGVLLSASFVIAAEYAQWGIIITAMAHLPLLLPLILIKPHVALPIALTRRPSRPGVLITGIILLLSLMVMPDWPWRWLGSTTNYERVIPLFVLPIGPLLLAALLAWRDLRAWQLVLMSLLPHRALYDLLPLWLLTRNWHQSLTLVGASWIVYLTGWYRHPFRVVMLLFLPALGFVLQPVVSQLFTQWSNRLRSQLVSDAGDASAEVLHES